MLASDQFRHLTIESNIPRPAPSGPVDLPSSQNAEARPTPKSKETTLRETTTLAIKNTQSTYTIKKIIIEANTTASPIGQTQSILISLLFI